MATKSRDVEPIEIDKEEMGRNQHEARKFILRHICNAIHLTVLAFIFFILYVCLINEWIYFTWHPILLAIGWVLLMVEGILILSPHNYFTNGLSHSTKVKYHWIIQGIGIGCTVIGFIIIYTNKNFKNKAHFHSWHGIIGLATVICCAPVSISGLLALYGYSLKNYISPNNSKFIHRICGVIAFSVGLITILLSLYTKWLQRNVNETFLIIWFGIILIVLLLTLLQPVINIYQKLKQLYKL